MAMISHSDIDPRLYFSGHAIYTSPSYVLEIMLYHATHLYDVNIVIAR